MFGWGFPVNRRRARIVYFSLGGICTITSSSIPGQISCKATKETSGFAAKEVKEPIYLNPGTSGIRLASIPGSFAKAPIAMRGSANSRALSVAILAAS